MAYTLFDIGACNCAATCTQTFTVVGCGGTNTLDAMTVNVYDATGVTLQGSAPTSAGVAVVSWAGASGLDHIVTVTGQSSRFAAFSTPLNLVCGGTQLLGPNPAPGFSCGLGCIYPISNTINVVFPGLSVVVTNPGGSPGWDSGPFTIGGNTYSVDLSPGPGGFGIAITGLFTGTCFVTPVTSVCPPSYMDTFNLTEGLPGDCGPFGTGAATATE
jgi:hypothetical protein